MIPGQFDYHKPKNLAEAVKLLAKYRDDGRAVAGGQSLIPMMKLRFAAPEHLIDIGGLKGLSGIKKKAKAVIIGALTTQHELLGSDVIAKTVPILQEAAGLIADPQVRYRGTVGGNVANGDPGNDMPALMLALGATYQLEGPRGKREVAAAKFYKGTYDTALKTGEILTSISVPVPPAGHGYAYEKLKRKVGDYATAAAAVVLTMKAGKVVTCAIALTNLADRPLLASEAAKVVTGSSLDAETLMKAADAARSIMDPAADGRGTIDYRTHVGGIMVIRALQAAAARAG